MNIITEVLAEVGRAQRKFPTWPTDPLHALAVLGEEFGELTKEVVQLTYEPHKSSKATLQQEAIQTAAMALRFCTGLNQYEFRPGPQHEQRAAAFLRSAGEVDDLRDNPPPGFVYDTIVTPYGSGRDITYYNGIGEVVEIWGCLLVPRSVCKDGTFYLLRPIKPPEGEAS